jgi:hypothetical protein
MVPIFGLSGARKSFFDVIMKVLDRIREQVLYLIIVGLCEEIK